MTMGPRGPAHGRPRGPKAAGKRDPGRDRGVWAPWASMGWAPWMPMDPWTHGPMGPWAHGPWYQVLSTKLCVPEGIMCTTGYYIPSFFRVHLFVTTRVAIKDGNFLIGAIFDSDRPRHLFFRPNKSVLGPPDVFRPFSTFFSTSKTSVLAKVSFLEEH